MLRILGCYAVASPMLSRQKRAEGRHRRIRIGSRVYYLFEFKDLPKRARRLLEQDPDWPILSEEVDPYDTRQA